MSVYDASNSQSGDHQIGGVAGRDITTHHVGADPSRLLDMVEELAVNGQQFRNLTAASLDKLATQVRDLQGDVSKGDATVLSMADARIATHRAAVAEQIEAVRAALEPRLQSLEAGALNAILTRLSADAAERRERQAVTDSVQRITLYAIGMLFAAVLVLAALIFLGRLI